MTTVTTENRKRALPKEILPKEIFIYPKITVKEQQQFLQRLTKTEEERSNISNLEQGTQAWKDSRYGRLSGSIIGAAVGHNPFTSHRKLLDDLLWSTFQGNEATAYGSFNESVAANIFSNYKSSLSADFKIHFCGSIIHDKFPFFAYSPDGIFTDSYNVKALLEIKCPFKKQFYATIPMMYYDQIQFGLYLTKNQFCEFVVYCPNETSIERFYYNEKYVKEFLLPKASLFYFTKYLPCLIAKEKGYLLQGNIDIPLDIEIEYFNPDLIF